MKVNVDGFAIAIQDILDDYSEEVAEASEEEIETEFNCCLWIWKVFKRLAVQSNEESRDNQGYCL